MCSVHPFLPSPLSLSPLLSGTGPSRTRLHSSVRHLRSHTPSLPPASQIRVGVGAEGGLAGGHIDLDPLLVDVDLVRRLGGAEGLGGAGGGEEEEEEES